LPKQIKPNAIFVADAHYPHHGDEFLTLLKKIDSKELTPPQLFLMGDIFDLLFGYNDYIQTFSKPAIELLQKISKELEVIYLEGNHDFCLNELFPEIQVYSRAKQPLHCQINSQDVYLSHGDKHKTKFGYNLYSNILRRKTTLILLKIFEKKIIDHRIGKLKRKKICGEFKGYKERFDGIIEEYPKDCLIVEGHFHQAIQYKNYISLPSLACQGEVGVAKNGRVEFTKF